MTLTRGLPSLTNHFSTPNYMAPHPTYPEQIHLPPYSPKTRPISQDLSSSERSGSFPPYTPAPPPYQNDWSSENTYIEWQHSRQLDTPRQQYLNRQRQSHRRFCLLLFLSLFFVTVFVIVAVIEIVGKTQTRKGGPTEMDSLSNL